MRFTTPCLAPALLCAYCALCTSCANSPSSTPATGCTTELEVRSTAAGVPFVRTPAACFEQLPDWDYEPRHVDIDGLRQGYVEAGPADGPVILLLHGQPAWSYLYRDMIPPLAAAGYRVLAMDHLGMGLSDKPTRLEDHSFATHVHRFEAFMEQLDLRDITLFAQDWGSVIALYSIGGDAERFARVIIANGGLPVVEAPARMPADIDGSNERFEQMLTMIPDRQPPFFDEQGNPLLPTGDGSGDVFGEWMAYAMHAEGFRPSLMVEALTYGPVSAAEEEAYDAPFPSRTAFAGPRTFPSLRNELVGITEPRLAGLETFERPFLTLFGGNDPGLSGEGDGQEWMMTRIPGAAGQPHHRYPDASHFLQEDKGPDLAARILEFIAATS